MEKKVDIFDVHVVVISLKIMFNEVSFDEVSFDVLTLSHHYVLSLVFISPSFDELKFNLSRRTNTDNLSKFSRKCCCCRPVGISGNETSRKRKAFFNPKVFYCNYKTRLLVHNMAISD